MTENKRKPGKKNKKISIITVCFNEVNTIERTIKSVLSQAYDETEYIIIDGQSSDGTTDIIRKYVDRLSYWVSERDDGIYDAMNKGVQKATGDIIGFINANDWYDEGVFKRVNTVFKNKKTDILYGDITVCNEGSTKRIDHRNVPIYGFSTFFPVLQPVSFVRADLLKANPFDTAYKVAADLTWFWMAKLKAYRFRYINKNIAFFTEGGTSAVVNKVSDEWRQVALEVAAIEIEKQYQYWRLISDAVDEGFKEALLKTVSATLGDKASVIGAGKNLARLIPLLEDAGVVIEDVFDDSNKKIICADRVLETKKKNEVTNAPAESVFFITSTDYLEEIEDEINPLLSGQTVVSFDELFTKAVDAFFTSQRNDE